jgi:hypothetical protein
LWSKGAVENSEGWAVKFPKAENTSTRRTMLISFSSAVDLAALLDDSSAE